MDSPTAIQISQMLADPASVTPGIVDDMRRRYPFFTLPAAMLLKYGNPGTLSPYQKRSLLGFIAANTADLPAMQEYVDLDRNDWASIYPQAEDKPQMSTEDTISTFLDTFGSTSPREEALLERLIFNPTPDYSQMLEQEERDNPSAPVDLADEDSQMARIDAFIAREHEIEQHGMAHTSPDDTPPTDEPHQPVTPPDAHDTANDTTLSESLAKIYIKQGRYERALEIISTLNLQYPKKSAYFADQLRFLQKLVKIEQLSKTKSPGQASPKR